MKTPKSRFICVLMGLIFMLPGGASARAQDAQNPQNSQAGQSPQAPPDAQDANAPDPPGRVARLNYVDGAVSFQPGGENDWVAAELNRPLATGDNLWSDENSRAEVHVGSTALRLGPKTGITLLDVSDRAAQIRLAEGSLIVNVRHVDDGDTYEVDTPNVAFTVMQPGDYRIDVDADGSRTDVAVWRGRGEVTGGGSSYAVVAGQQATFTGGDQIAYDMGQAPTGDGFDNWAFERDRAEDEADAANYVSRDMTGYEDLDQYGDWSYVAGYGTVWRPRVVVAGWAPYRDGHWAWVGPWGWTWVAGEPWGFAPFHYGRWAYSANAWVWVPGAVAVRPIYAPALVGWIGAGPRANFSFGAGVGWVPLAPGEVFVPGYHVSRAYVNRVNTTNTTVNVTQITNVYNTVAVNRNATPSNITYANRGVSGGVTVVSRETFVNARPVARNVVSVPAKELAAAPVSGGVAAEPVRASVLGAGKPVGNRPPVAVTSRQVVALRTPAAMPRSFEQRQSHAVARSASQPLVRQQAPGRPVPTANQAARQPKPQTQYGFRSFGDGNGGSTQANPQPRVWEAQGTPEPERAPETRPRSRGTPAPQPALQRTLVKSAAPTQQRSAEQEHQQEQKSSNWQRPVSASKPAQHSSSSSSSSASGSKKAH